MHGAGDVWVEHLPPGECWRLLASSPVGRVGVLVDSAPEIYPVNHVAVGETIVFRTDPGAKLRGLVRSPAVCFEVDAVDLVARTGWSVLVKGRAEEIDAPSEGGGVDVWTLGDKAYWVRIVPAEVTGRRIHRS